MMKFEKSESGMLYPKEKKPDHISHPNGLPDEERLKTFMFEIYYELDKEPFEKLVEENGGIMYGWTEVRKHNAWNQQTNWKYIGIYQCTKELEMFVLC